MSITMDWATALTAENRSVDIDGATLVYRRFGDSQTDALTPLCLHHFRGSSTEADHGHDPPQPDDHIDARAVRRALTDFGPGRQQIFGRSADGYLKVHDHVGRQLGPHGRALGLLLGIGGNRLLGKELGKTVKAIEARNAVGPRMSTTADGSEAGGWKTLSVSAGGSVLFADLAAPPMNLLGPELVRDLVSLIERAEADNTVQVLVFRSADPDYFIAHVDVRRIDEYRAEAAKLAGEPSLGLLFRHLSTSRLITIAQIEGRVRGAGSEFVLACDMRFAARESAIFSQPEVGFGLIPGAGGVQHLTRLMGRARALEVLLSGEDYNAELAERYGWINRALPADELGHFVRSLAHRIADFPAAGRAAIKDRVNTIALASIDDFRRDSDLFAEASRAPEAQGRTRAAMQRGFQTREGELALAQMLADLGSSPGQART